MFSGRFATVADTVAYLQTLELYAAFIAAKEALEKLKEAVGGKRKEWRKFLEMKGQGLAT